ncbi:hypothetical protein DPMN_057213 [Dreissena polymorpha]|uniref:Uncharacterized protein n=1 Tax=Dreissena polymorpha TaxID=45954 RepID=A0A9D4CT43_DREPO|nr:hypothetical protein DPMN_057213 [Dreissena polymorpha]
MTSPRYSQPWVNKKIRRLSNKKKRAHMKACKSNDTQYIEYYNQLRKSSKYKCKRAYNSYVNNLTTDDHGKKLYSFIKSKL